MRYSILLRFFIISCMILVFSQPIFPQTEGDISEKTIIKRNAKGDITEKTIIKRNAKGEVVEEKTLYKTPSRGWQDSPIVPNPPVPSTPKRRYQPVEEEYHPPQERRYPGLTVGIKIPLSLTVDQSSTTDLSFLDSNFSRDGGVGMGLGLSVEIIPFRSLAIETGFYYRTFEISGWDVTYSEFQVPFIAKFRMPVNNKLTFLVGLGGSYFTQRTGTIDPDGAGAGKEPIDMPDQDLRDGFSFIAKLELQQRSSSGLIYNLDIGYERSTRSLDIISHDLFFNVGIGLIIF